MANVDDWKDRDDGEEKTRRWAIIGNFQTNFH